MFFKKEKFIALALSVIALFSLVACKTDEKESESGFKTGEYAVAAELSCYVNAMGGVEFGRPLMTGAVMTVDENGEKTLTLSFIKSSVTIYSVTCYTFVDAAPAADDENTTGVEFGTIGYYAPDGILITDGVSYELSAEGDTATNAEGGQVRYVTSVTFPIDTSVTVYNLTMYINSQVMGCQFSMNGKPAVLTLDWTNVTEK